MSTVPNQSAEVVKLDLSAGSIHTVMLDGKPGVILKPAVDELGLDFRTQLRKLKTRSWATVGALPTVAEDGKIREMTAVPVRTFLMLLASINEHRVREELRPILVAFQNETADAIEAYWTRGGAINPAATPEQIGELRTELDAVERAVLARHRIEAIGAAKQFHLVNDSYLEGLVRTELARMSGEEPDVDPLDMTITCDEYLGMRGVAGADLPSARTRLGKTVAALYRARHSKDPQRIKRPINGVHREVAVYTQRDIDLFDTAWVEVGRHYNQQQAIAPLDGAA